MIVTAESFAYWLQGFFELTGSDELTPDQVKIVKDHLALVFTKVTPDPSSLAWVEGCDTQTYC